MIPKIIYKTGPFEKSNLPNEVEIIFNKTIDDNPECELVYFDDIQCLEFITKNFNSRILKAYNSLVPTAYKADLFRYCILYQKGGIWSDLTQTFIEPISNFIDFEKDDFILVEGGYIPCAEKRGFEIAFMASKPKNEIYLKAIEKIIENIESDYYGCSSFNPTGPIMFRELMESSNITYKLGFEFKRFGDDSGNDDFICYENIFNGDSKKIIKTRTINHGKYLYHDTNKPHYSELHRDKKIYNK